MNLARILLAALPFLPAFGPQEAKPTAAESFVCPPCGAECHFTTYPKPGACGVCGMSLVPLASVPQVGVLLYPGVALSSSLPTLALLAGANAARVFCVADTAEPLRLFDTLEVRPQFSFADAPPLDVLVVPNGFGAWDDPMIVEWVKKNAEHARFVLAEGAAGILLARAGFLAGERVPARGYVLRPAKQLAPGLTLDDTIPWRRTGKFFLARDPDASLDAALALVQELAGEERAKQTATEFGREWKPVAK